MVGGGGAGRGAATSVQPVVPAKAGTQCGVMMRHRTPAALGGELEWWAWVLDSGLRRNDEVGLAAGGGGAALRAMNARIIERIMPARQRRMGTSAPARHTGKATAKRHQPSSPSYRRRPVPSAACDEAPDAATLGA